MSLVRSLVPALALALALPSPALAAPLTPAQLQTMITNMGYAPNVLSKPGEAMKFEIKTTAGTFTVPISFEVTPSGRYIWATANLGSAATMSGDKALALLRKNVATQPVMFWISTNNQLICGMAIDNREVTPAHMKYVIDKIGADIAGSADVWGK